MYLKLCKHRNGSEVKVEWSLRLLLLLLLRLACHKLLLLRDRLLHLRASKLTKGILSLRLLLELSHGLLGLLLVSIHWLLNLRHSSKLAKRIHTHLSLGLRLDRLHLCLRLSHRLESIHRCGLSRFILVVEAIELIRASEYIIKAWYLSIINRLFWLLYRSSIENIK